MADANQDQDVAAAGTNASPAKATVDAPATPATPAAPTQADAINAVIDTWLNGFYNSPISQDTRAWNFLYERIPALKAAIAQEL